MTAARIMVQSVGSSNAKVDAEPHRGKGKDAIINFVNPRLKQFKMAFILACIIGFLTTFTTAMIAYGLWKYSCQPVQSSLSLPFLTGLSDKGTCTPKSFRYWIIGDSSADSSGTFNINSWKFAYTNQPAAFQILQEASKNALRALRSMDPEELKYEVVNGYTMNVSVPIPYSGKNMTFKMTFSRTKSTPAFNPDTDVVTDLTPYDANYQVGSKTEINTFTLPTEVMKELSRSSGSDDSRLVDSLLTAGSAGGSMVADPALLKAAMASAFLQLGLSSDQADNADISSVFLGGDLNSFNFGDLFGPSANLSSLLGSSVFNFSSYGGYGDYDYAYNGSSSSSLLSGLTSSSTTSFGPPTGPGTGPETGPATGPTAPPALRRRLLQAMSVPVTSGNKLPDTVWNQSHTFTQLRGYEWQVTIESIGFDSKVPTPAKVQKDLIDKLLRRGGKNVTKSGPEVYTNQSDADQLLQGTFQPGAQMDPTYATKEWCTFRMPAQRWVWFLGQNNLDLDDVGNNNYQLTPPQCCVFLPSGENWCAILQEQAENLNKQTDGTEVWDTIMGDNAVDLWSNPASSHSKIMTTFMLRYMDRTLSYWVKKMTASRFGPEFRLSMNGVSLNCEDVVCQSIPGIIGQALGWSVYAELVVSIAVLGIYFVIVARQEHMTMKDIVAVLVATATGKEDEPPKGKGNKVRPDDEGGATEGASMKKLAASGQERADQADEALEGLGKMLS